MSIQEPQSESDLSSSSDDSLSTRKIRLRANKKKSVTLVATQENKTALTIPNSRAVLKQSDSARCLMEDISEITQSDTTMVIRSEVHSEMLSMRTELLQMQAKIQEYHTTQTNLVDTVQTMQDDTKEIRGSNTVYDDGDIETAPANDNPTRQSPLSQSSATNQDTTNLQITPGTPSTFYPFRPGERRKPESSGTMKSPTLDPDIPGQQVSANDNITTSSLQTASQLMKEGETQLQEWMTGETNTLSRGTHNSENLGIIGEWGDRINPVGKGNIRIMFQNVNGIKTYR